MIINHNMASLNTYNKLSSNNTQTSKALEKLSSGLRINRAGDDAAGLAISEKMRGQIRGLDQASRNSQDAISMLQTAEGSLSETQSILQRMKELATQAANDSNVGVDRGEIQKEINQLTSEINRIGNTTEFNTQKLLCGDGKVNLASTGLVNPGTVTANGAVTTVEAKQVIDKLEIKTGYTASNTVSVTLNGKTLSVKLVDDGSLTSAAAVDTASATANSITVKYDATAALDISTALGSAFTTLINNDADLAGNFTISASAAKTLTVEATKGGTAAGVKGSIAATTFTDATATAWTTALDAADLLASVGTTTDTKSTVSIGLDSVDTLAEAQALLGKGMTINGTQIEFYDANAGAYTGSAIGVNISEWVKAGATPAAGDITDEIVAQVNGKIDGVTLSNSANKLAVTATAVGKDGDGIAVRDGGAQEDYEATFQIGANMGQSMSIEINDMRSKAILVSGTTASGKASVDGAVFTATTNVTNGTNSTNVEYALDVSDHDKATAAIKVISNAIETVSAERSKIGAYTNRLEHTIANLGTASENTTAAESRIRDVDMAKEMMNFQKNNILSQAAQAMLAQANQQPQGVLQLLR